MIQQLLTGLGSASTWQAIGQLLKDPLGTTQDLWDQFLNGKNTQNQREANETNLKIAEDTNQTNREIAEQNLAFQQQQAEYQKALQERMFDREDTAYQRTVKDMRQAGMSPLAMNGTNGAGQEVSMTTPQNNFQAQIPSPVQAIKQASPMDMLNAVTSIVDQSNRLKQSQISLEQQTEQLTRQKLENQDYARNRDLEQEYKYWANNEKREDFERKNLENSDYLEWSNSWRERGINPYDLQNPTGLFYKKASEIASLIEKGDIKGAKEVLKYLLLGQ